MQHFLEQDYMDMNRRIMDMDTIVRNMKKNWSYGNDSQGSQIRIDILGHRLMNQINVYNGNVETYEQWSSKLRNSLGSYDKEFKIALKALESLKQEPNLNDLTSISHDSQIPEARLTEILEQVWLVLITKVEGGAYHLIRNYDNVQEGIRGGKAWWKLANHVLGINGNRLVALHQRIGNPTRCINMHELQQSMDIWESLVSEYERGVGSKLPDSALLAGLVGLLPLDMAHQIQSSPGMDSYGRAKEYVERQIAQRRDPWNRHLVAPIDVPIPKSPTVSNSDMDMGFMNQDEGSQASTGSSHSHEYVNAFNGLSLIHI